MTTKYSQELADAIDNENDDADLPALIDETGFVHLETDFSVNGVTRMNGKCPFCRGGHLEVVVIECGEYGSIPSTYRCLDVNCSQSRPGFAVDYLVALDGMTVAEAVVRLMRRPARASCVRPGRARAQVQQTKE